MVLLNPRATRALGDMEGRLEEEKAARVVAENQVKELNAKVEELTAKLTWGASEWGQEHRENAVLRDKIKELQSSTGAMSDALQKENRYMKFELSNYTGLLLDDYAHCHGDRLLRLHRCACNVVREFTEPAVVGDKIEWLQSAAGAVSNPLQEENRRLKHQVTAQRDLVEAFACMPENDLFYAQGVVKFALKNFPWFRSRWNIEAEE